MTDNFMDSLRTEMETSLKSPLASALKRVEALPDKALEEKKFKLSSYSELLVITNSMIDYLGCYIESIRSSIGKGKNLFIEPFFSGRVKSAGSAADRVSG